MAFRVLSIILLLLTGRSCSQTAFAQIAIFNSSPSAMPGEAVSLQGNFGESAKFYCVKGVSTTPVPLPVLVQSANQATVQIPNQLGLDFYQVWVQDQGLRSPAVYVNNAMGMHFDTPEIVPGGTLRIFGRNLQLPGLTARVRMVAQGTNYVREAQLVPSQSDAYKLSLRLPTNLEPGKVYTVYINNGKGEFPMERTVTAIAPGQDYFQLGVGWAAKLNFYANVYNVKTDPRLSLKAVGDGVANDQLAIQQAIDRAYLDGGGIVYLPAGTYKLLTNYFEYVNMRNRVVLQGAGKDQTVLKFGYDISTNHVGVYWPPITTQAGLADLTFQNVDNTGNNLTSNMYGQGAEVFLQRIRFELNRSNWLWWANSDKVVIANSDIKQGLTSNFGYHGILQLNGCTNFVVANNNITYAVDGLSFNTTHQGVFENNRVYRDGSARYPSDIVNHVLILNFAQNVAVLNNLFKVINGPAQNRNDGETIIAEGGGPDRLDEETGVASGATATTLQDNTKNWGSFKYKPVVAIVHGKGMGQWRNITSRSGNTLNLDRAWSVLPGAGSRYAIFNWGSRNWLVQGNTMEGNRRGITLYHNATNQVAIVGNTLTNSGSIDLTTLQENNGNQRFIPMYSNQVVGNSVANTDGSNGVFIGVHAVQHAQEKTFGTSVIGLEVRNNTVTAGRPNIPAVVDDNFPEGYLNYLEYHPITFYTDENIPAVLGSIFENNTAVNCDNALHLNSGSYNTFVCNLRLVNSANGVKDSSLDRVNHGSIKTSLCTSPSQNSGQIPKEEEALNIRIYPNPFTAELYVHLSTAGARVELYSITGVMLSDTYTNTTEVKLNTQYLPIGNYVVTVIPNNGLKASQRFTKQASN